MYILGKVKELGGLWVVRRIAREFINPTTHVGKLLKPFSIFIYYLFNKPINFFCTLASNCKSINTLYFFYDFEVEPITYDFAWALCIANAKREELGLSHLCIVFVPGNEKGLRKEDEEYERIVDHDARSWRIYSILIPLIKMLSCPTSLSFCSTRNEAIFLREKQAKFVYPEKYNVTFPVPYSPREAMYYRQKFMALRADKQALKYVSTWLTEHAFSKKVIVITLRQYAYSLERNSNISDWVKFANTLDKEEFFVVFVPDIDQALCEIPDELKTFHLFDPACWSLNLRGALYELAYLNLGVNTGPMSLCWLNPVCRYISFKTTVKNVAQASIEVLIDRGFVPGENPQFTKPFQKWVWNDDVFDIILLEFKLMCEAITKGV